MSGWDLAGYGKPAPKSGPKPVEMTKSGPKLVEMTRSETMGIEITTGADTVLRTNDPAMASAFLGSIGQQEVRLVCSVASLTTGADIAKLVVEHAYS